MKKPGYRRALAFFAALMTIVFADVAYAANVNNFWVGADKNINSSTGWNVKDSGRYPGTSGNDALHISFWHTRLTNNVNGVYNLFAKIPNETVSMTGTVSVATSDSKWFDFRALGANSVFEAKRKSGDQGNWFIAATNIKEHG